MDYKAIGNRIRTYRKQKNFSQEKLAEKINISTTHMSHIETGTTKLSLPVLVKIAEVLDISTDIFLFGEQHSKNPNSLADIFNSCTPEELEIITEIVKSVKEKLSSFSLKKH